jgi:hypothetical protein
MVIAVDYRIGVNSIQISYGTCGPVTNDDREGLSDRGLATCAQRKIPFAGVVRGSFFAVRVHAPIFKELAWSHALVKEEPGSGTSFER